MEGRLASQKSDFSKKIFTIVERELNCGQGGMRADSEHFEKFMCAVKLYLFQPSDFKFYMILSIRSVGRRRGKIQKFKMLYHNDVLRCLILNRIKFQLEFNFNILQGQRVIKVQNKIQKKLQMKTSKNGKNAVLH